MALLRQHLRQHRGIANPSAALMKAMVVNAATVPATASAAPDNTRGFGWLNLEQLLTPPPTGQQVFSDDVQLAVATGEVRQLAVQVADPSLPLRVTLVWTDRPGKGLQNRLYLRLVPPGGGAADRRRRHRLPEPDEQRAARPRGRARRRGRGRSRSTGIDVPFGIPALAPALRQDFALAISNGVGLLTEAGRRGQVIDHSGSMGFYSFMVPARERSKQLVDVLRVNDRTGVVMFDGSAATVQPVVPILGAATQTTIKTAIDTIAPAGVTSIGAGLQQGVADLAAGGDPSHPAAIVLVSDGHENTPPWVGGGVTDSPPVLVRRAGPHRGPARRCRRPRRSTPCRSAWPATRCCCRTSPRHRWTVPVDPQRRRDRQAARDLRPPPGARRRGRGHRRRQRHGRRLGAGANALSGTRSAIGRAPQDLPELEGLLDPTSAQGRAAVGAGSPLNIHTVPVDDTMTSATFVVSWHDPARPVQMSLVSPSLSRVHTDLGAGHHHDRLELHRHAHRQPGTGPVAAAGQRRRRQGPVRLHLGRPR